MILSFNKISDIGGMTDVFKNMKKLQKLELDFEYYQNFYFTQKY